MRDQTQTGAPDPARTVDSLPAEADAPEDAPNPPGYALLGEIGLSARADMPAAALSHGEQRALEVGVALATRPRLLLLDEPMAGMGPDESAQMVALIASLRSELTIVLVEHDMDVVFRLADRISVLVYGRLLATGPAEDIRANDEVRRAYLGTDAA